MRCNCVMMSPRVISPIEEEGANVDGADKDRVKREGEAIEFDYHDLNCALLHLTVATSMADMTKKWSE